MCYRSDTTRQLSNRRNLVNLDESARIRRRYRYALSFRICHVPSRSDENESTVVGKLRPVASEGEYER